ncbi:MAG: transcription antitermination factor NusB [bacterium]
MSRKKEREEAFKSLYAREVKGNYEGKEKSSFVREIVEGVDKNTEELDEMLNGRLKNWRMERVYPVEKILLRMGLYELLHMDTERAVVINEAVELAKKFGARDTSAFVNGILDDFEFSGEEKSE